MLANGADEPTAALDSSLSRDVAKLLRDITAEQQTATMFVTHDRSLLKLNPSLLLRRRTSNYSRT